MVFIVRILVEDHGAISSMFKTDNDFLNALEMIINDFFNNEIFSWSANNVDALTNPI